MPMRAPAPVRRAAVQSLTDRGPAFIVRRGQASTPLKDPLLDIRERQAYARTFAHILGPVRGTVNGKAETCARCRLTVLERPEGSAEWVESENAAFATVFDRLRNAQQDYHGIVHDIAYRRSVDGEMFFVSREANTGPEFSVHAPHLVTPDQPEKDSVLVRLVPGGKPDDGTAFVVPKPQAKWILEQDPDAPLYPTSPLLGSIDDLRLARTASRRVYGKIENLLAMDGVFWLPGEAMQLVSGAYDEEGAAEDLGTAGTAMERMYYDAAQLRFREDQHDIASLVPTMMHWPHELGPPQYVALGQALDPELRNTIEMGYRGYASAENVPADLVLGGGAPGDVNHWTGWLVQDQNFKLAIAPLMDDVCADINDAWFRPLLGLSGLNPAQYRVGYDAAEVVVRPDQSTSALQLNQAGLLNRDATLEAANFNPDVDAMRDEDERQWLLAVKSAGKAGEVIPGEAPAGLPLTTTQTQAPPSGATNGQAPAPPPTPVSVAAVLASALAQYADGVTV